MSDRVYIEKQPEIQAPCKTYTGHIMTAEEVAQYNAYLGDINKNAGKSLRIDSEAFKEREHWLDQRHRFFVAICNSGVSRPN